MRQSQGSLSKEFPLSQVEAVIQLAENGLSYDSFRELAAQRGYPDIPALVVNRFLLLEDDRIVRDRFLSLAKSEGIGTPRMRKIMYGIWAMRDPRVQRFILEVICDPTGKWQFDETVNKANSTFFENFFAPSTAPKVRSNIQYFLEEANILNTGSNSIQLGLEDGWLEDAMLAASQYEESAKKRRAMIADPFGFAIANNLNGLANITLVELKGAKAIVLPDAEETSDTEISLPETNLPPGKKWDRKQPTYQTRKTTTVEIDSIARERASSAHYALERLFVKIASDTGHQAEYNEHIDIYFLPPLGSVIVEIKSCHPQNTHIQIRRGVSQLLEYEYVYRTILKKPVQKILAIEVQLPVKLKWLSQYLAQLNIILLWRREDGAGFETDHALPPHIQKIIGHTAPAGLETKIGN